MATSEDTLKTIRPQIERYTQHDDDDGQRQLAKNWRFLDGEGGERGRGGEGRKKEGGRERESALQIEISCHVIMLHLDCHFSPLTYFSL